MKFLYKLFHSLFLRFRNVRVSPFSMFNCKSYFEGYNVIHKGAVVSGSILGRNTFVGENSFLPNCKIGRFCSIAADVKVVSLTHPSNVYVSTCPSFYSTAKQNGQSFVTQNRFNETLKKGRYNVIIGNDVWIGTNVLIKGGVEISDGAIIAMGAVVTKDVPPFSIVAGVPAKVLKHRFTDEQIRELQRIKWWEKSEEWIRCRIDRYANIEDFVYSSQNEK